MEIRVKAGTGVLKAYAPYSKRFVEFAHMRNAKWSDSLKCWLFDPRDEFALRSTLIDIFGTDDYEQCAKVDARVRLDEIKSLAMRVSRLFFFGRELARRRYSDRYVDLGPGVVIVSGGFPPTGGRHCELDPFPGTVLEARGVPVQKAEQVQAKYAQAVEILGEYDLTRLREEREYHLKRVAEIDALLARGVTVGDEEEGILADLEDDIDEAPGDGRREAVQG